MNAATNLLTLDGRTIFTLPKSIPALVVSRRCRAALLSFVNGAEKWSKRDLALWLAGPYTLVTQAAGALVENPPRQARARRAVDPRTIACIVAESVEFARDLLRASMRTDGGGVTAWDAWQRGLIVRCEDAYLNEGWVPLDLPRLRMRDRVTSLWAADYLANTGDYESTLAVCEICGHASFDPFLRPSGRCEEHAPRQIEVQWPDGNAMTYTSHLSARNAPPSGIRRR
jgi:hypothetical protein